MLLTPFLRKVTDADMSELVPGFHDIAKSALLIGACVYAVFAALHIVTQPPGLREPLFATAGMTALLFIGFHIAARYAGPRSALLNWAMFLITLFAWFNSALHLWLSGAPMQTTNLAMVVVAAGILLIDVVEFVAIVGLSIAVLASAWAAQGGGGGIWIHYGVLLLEATVLASATFSWKWLALRRNRELRERELRVREAAEQNLHRAQDADVTLRESEERFRTLFALAPVGIAVNRMTDGRFLIGSTALFEMVGYTEAEFEGLTYWDITPREYDVDEARALESLRSEGRYGPYEKEYIRKGGKRFPVLLQGRRLTDNTGQDIILSVIQDISAQKSTEAALASARDAAVRQYGLSYGPKIKPRWWLGE